MNQVNTTYDKKVQEQRATDMAIEVLKNIAEHKNKIPTYPSNLVSMMNLVEDTIAICRGEKLADFREVCRDTIKVYTRIPQSAMLLPPDTPSNIENQRISKLITTLLVTHPSVFGVRWVPDENRVGSYIVVSLERGEFTYNG